MKNALIKLLALATLATSMSAFAATGESKHKDAAASGKQQSGCADTQETKKEKKNKKQQNESQEEKDFDRVLMGTHG